MFLLPSPRMISSHQLRKNQRNNVLMAKEALIDRSYCLLITKNHIDW